MFIFTSEEEVESASDQESKIKVLLNTLLYSAIIMSLSTERGVGEFTMELPDWLDTFNNSFSWEQENKNKTRNVKVYFLFSFVKHLVNN